MVAINAEDGFFQLEGVTWVSEPAAQEWGLILRGVGIRTGVSHGYVDVTVRRVTERPTDAELSAWEDVVEAPAMLTADAAARAMNALPVPEARLTSVAGLHGVLIGSSGRDASPDAADDESGEQYIVVAWPIATPMEPAVRWLRSKRGREFAAGSPPPTFSASTISVPFDAVSGEPVGRLPVRYNPAIGDDR